MAIEVFNRFEHKYKLDEETFNKVIEVIDKHMVPDKYCPNHSLYTIANVYYDTTDDYLIRNSLSKPSYKEKLRMRAYGVPNEGDKVFLEIKKKYRGLVNKRRTSLELNEACHFCETGAAPDIQPYMNEQVVHELEYFIEHYNVEPKVYIAYDRLAYFEKGNDDLRISFDTNIRARRENVRLDYGDEGELLLPEGTRLMEIKTSRAFPLWLVQLLSKYKLRRSSFSKYGTEYKRQCMAV